MERSEQDVAYALECYKILAWPMGVWPIGDNAFYSKIRWSFAIISEFLLVISLVREVYLGCEDSQDDPISTYVVILSAILVIVKLSLLRMRRCSLSAILSCAIQDWRDVKDSKSREIMMQHGRIARIIALSLFSSGFFAYMLYMFRLLPFLNKTGGRVYYLPTSCLLESASTFEYVAVTCYQIIQLFITYAGNCCTEGIFVGITMHLCGQLELLMINFRQINRSKHKCRGSIVEELVLRHRHLLKLVETIENTYNVIVLTQILNSAILICVTGFSCIESAHVNDTIMMVKSIVVMIVMLLQSFLYTFAGDNLREQSEAMSFAIYDSNWCDFPSSDVRDLAFIMIKTNIPLRLTAGKFFYITRVTFTDILKTSVSYLSALRVMIEKEETNSP